MMGHFILVGKVTYIMSCYINIPGDLDETGVRVGLGHLEIPNGSTYDGSFSKGLPNGIGIMTFPDSSRYEGEFMQVGNIRVKNVLLEQCKALNEA